MPTEDIEWVQSVDQPTVDGVPVAFVFAHWVNNAFSIFFDFSHNNDDAPLEKAGNWSLCKQISTSLHATIIEYSMDLYSSNEADLRRIGLWAAPALLPYPLSKIISLIQGGREPDAAQLLVDHFTATRLFALVSNWWSIPAFAIRRQLFEEGLEAHNAGHFHLSVSTLMPHIEGVMTDWMLDNGHTFRYRQESKTEDFQAKILGTSDSTSIHKQIVGSALGFILDGPVLATFKNWFDSFDTTFPNRNVVGHGKYDDSIYTQESSVKLLLMFDSIRRILPPPVATT